MIVIRYTGWGWLAFMLFMAVGVACFMLSSALGLRDDAFLLGFAVWYDGYRADADRLAPMRLLAGESGRDAVHRVRHDGEPR